MTDKEGLRHIDFGHKSMTCLQFSMIQLLMVDRIMRQRFTAFCTWGRRTATACAAVGAGVMPNTSLVLGRFWLLGCCIGCRIGRVACRCSGVISGIMGERCATFCAWGSRAAATFTAFWAGVMPDASCVLRGLLFGGIWRGSRGRHLRNDRFDRIARSTISGNSRYNRCFHGGCGSWHRNRTCGIRCSCGRRFGGLGVVCASGKNSDRAKSQDRWEQF